MFASKIALLLLTWAVTVMGTTPPNRPRKERRRPDNVGSAVRLETKITVSGGWLVAQSFISIAALIEIAFVYANAHQQNAFSKFFLDALCHRPVPTNARTSDISALLVLGVLFTIGGTAIRIACYREMGAFFTFDITFQKDHKLVTTGPYAVVRHPSYLGAMMIIVGIMAGTSGPGSWFAGAAMRRAPTPSAPWIGLGGVFACLWAALLAYGVLFLSRAPTEDAVLKRAFGREWEAYARKVRFWYVPGLI